MAATREGGVFVEALAAAGEVGDEGVEEDVGGAGVEGEDVLRLGAGGDDGDIGDAAEIERDAADFFVAIEEVVGERDERGALASGGHVGGAEVGDGGDAGEVGDEGAVRDLECGACWLAQERNWLALMKDGLAVGGDQVEAFRRKVEFFAGGEGGFGEEVAETEI